MPVGKYKLFKYEQVKLFKTKFKSERNILIRLKIRFCVVNIFFLEQKNKFIQFPLFSFIIIYLVIFH